MEKKIKFKNIHIYISQSWIICIEIVKLIAVFFKIDVNHDILKVKYIL